MTVKSLEFLINVAIATYCLTYGCTWSSFSALFFSPMCLLFSCHFLSKEQVTSVNSKDADSQGLEETMEVEGKPQHHLFFPSFHTNAGLSMVLL